MYSFHASFNSLQDKDERLLWWIASTSLKVAFLLLCTAGLLVSS